MATRSKAKKNAAPVITAKEQLVRDQAASLARAVNVERRVKRTMRLLERLQERNRLDLLSLSEAIAKRAGYTLARITASA